MRIVRFIDDKGDICYGYEYRNNTAARLNGDLFKGFTDTGNRIAVTKLLAPVQPSSILCIGLNYHQHAIETGARLPEHPILFMKNPATLNHPGDSIVIPKSCMSPPEVDYEAELAVVLKKAARNVKVSEALTCVAGYTIGNDVSARRWQKHAGGGQWVKGKSFDTFCPLGPALVTSDEIADPQALRITCTVNGHVMQDAHTSDMIFSVAQIIAYLSDDMTLLPGTVILTGTPGGVGFVRKPPVYLKPGDTVEMTIDPIGTLISPVV